MIRYTGTEQALVIRHALAPRGVDPALVGRHLSAG